MNGGIVMSSYREYREKALQNPDVKVEYDALQPEYDIIQAMIDARNSQHITQKELAAKTGITQADISRIENGTRNPSLAMVKRIAEGLGMQLRLEFIPTASKMMNNDIVNITLHLSLVHPVTCFIMQPLPLNHSIAFS